MANERNGASSDSDDEWDGSDAESETGEPLSALRRKALATLASLAFFGLEMTRTVATFSVRIAASASGWI